MSYDEWYKNRHSNGKIYFILTSDGKFVKIGYSINVDQRIHDLQDSCPLDLILIGCVYGSMKEEKRLHSEFNKYSVRGEWYHANLELLTQIHNYIDMCNCLK